MHTKHEPDDPEVLNAMGYDRRDVDIPLISKATIWTTVLSIGCFIAALVIYNFITTGSPTGAGREAAAKSRNRIPSGTPILQDNITTKLDIEEMRRIERDHLTKPTWVDQNKGVVRVPIDRAMDLVAERGVATGEEVSAKTTGNTIPQNAVGPGAN